MKWMIVLVMALALVGCREGGGDDGGWTRGEFGDDCESDDDCLIEYWCWRGECCWRETVFCCQVRDDGSARCVDVAYDRDGRQDLVSTSSEPSFDDAMIRRWNAPCHREDPNCRY